MQNRLSHDISHGAPLKFEWTRASASLSQSRRAVNRAFAGI
jgi:hypothetical protein